VCNSRLAMSTDSLQQETNSETKRFRLVVRSAEEAVRLIKEKLGDQAKVVSVRQVGGEGLKRFISSPKLEVIAELSPASDADEDESETSEKLSGEHLPELAEKPRVDESIKSASNLSEEVVANDPIKDGDSVSALLQKTGFDENLLSQIKSWSNWNEIKDLPLADSLKHITIGLSDRYKSNPDVPLGNTVALIGTPGSGKTTTLCKILAHEVFINKKVPMVLKMENGVPNPDDSLRIFCEVIGVTLYREASRLPQPTDDRPLYVDLPGLSLGRVEDWGQTKEALDHCNIESRILVINGAYDLKVLNRSIQTSKHLGGTHIAITHFDELSNATKLWPVVLGSGMTPFCICNGQNVTGDFSRGVLNQMISKTFPEELYSRGFASYQKI